MPRKIKATLPDGRKIKLTVPDGASNEDIKDKLQQISQPFDDRSLLQKAGDLAVSATEKTRGLAAPLQERLASLGPVIGQAAQQASLPSQLGLQAAGAVQEGFDVSGEALAETLSGPGLTAKPLFGQPGLPVLPAPAEAGEQGLRTSPEVAAAIGTGVQMVPDIASAFIGGPAAIGAKRLGLSALKKTLTPKGIGAQIGAAEKAAGVSKRLTTTKSLKDVLQLPGRGDFTTVANKVDELLTAGQKLPKQFLSDFRVALKKALNTPAFSRGEPQALLLNIKDKADDAFNALVPGRAKLSKKFSQAKSRERLLKSLGGAVTTGAKVAVGGSIAAGLLNALR